MSQDLLDVADWTAIEEELGSRGVPEDMRPNRLCKLRKLPVPIKVPPDIRALKLAPPVNRGEERGMTIGALFQVGIKPEDRALGQEGDPLLVPLPDHLHLAVFEIDLFSGQRKHFADTEGTSEKQLDKSAEPEANQVWAVRPGEILSLDRGDELLDFRRR